MKKTYKREFTNICLVPEDLGNDILSIGFSKIRLNQAIKLINFLKRSSSKATGLPCCEVMVPSSYLEKMFSSKYPEIINPLVEKGIVFRNNSYSAGNGKSKKYNLSSKYFEDFAEKSISNIKGNIGDIIGVDGSSKRGMILSYKSHLFFEGSVDEKITDNVKRNLKSLKIDVKNLQKKATELVASIRIESLILDEQIEDTHFLVRRLVDNSIISHWIKRDKALEISKNLGVSLIKDGSRFYIMSVDTYLSMKRNWKNFSYHESIHKLSKGVFLASRNDTNGRLDSNITNMSSELLDIILEDNSLVQVDLSNSQLAILANQLPKNLNSSETVEFKERAINGILYEFIQEGLGLSSRKEAKQTTFEVLFSSYKNKSSRIDGMHEVFPELMSFINNYKIDNGSNQFAIWLQKYESNLFIDGVLKTLYRKRIFALTKHDSVICKRQDLQKVLDVISDVFSKNNFKGKLAY